MLASRLKVPKIVASERTENRRFRQPHYRSTPPLHRTPANIRINLTLSETRVIGLHPRPDSMGLSSFQFSWWAPKDACVFETERVMTLQGHPRSLMLAPIKSAYATSYWSSIAVTLVLSCSVSEVFC